MMESLELTMSIFLNAHVSQISALKHLLTEEQLEAYEKFVEARREEFIAKNPQLSEPQKEAVSQLFR
jgi:hypothetical protein